MEEPSLGTGSANYNLFRECLSATVLAAFNTNQQSSKAPKHRRRKSSSIKAKTTLDESEGELPADPSNLVDFIEYLASEIFPSVPLDLQSLSYSTIQRDPTLAERYSLPLSISTVEAMLTNLPPSIPETLTIYSLLPPTTSATISNFLSAPLSSYISTVSAPPTSLNLTRKSPCCEICDRAWIPLTAHHLVPRSVAKKAVRRGWCEEWETEKIAWLCRACHSFVHRMEGNEELARGWRDVGVMLGREDVKEWRSWVGSVRWKKR